jgi:hypothetical protein
MSIRTVQDEHHSGIVALSAVRFRQVSPDLLRDAELIRTWTVRESCLPDTLQVIGQTQETTGKISTFKPRLFKTNFHCVKFAFFKVLKSLPSPILGRKTIFRMTYSDKIVLSSIQPQHSVYFSKHWCRSLARRRMKQQFWYISLCFPNSNVRGSMTFEFFFIF